MDAESFIRVSDRVKTRLDDLKRDDESYNDVLERLVDQHAERDFTVGFGILAESDTVNQVESVHEAMNDQLEERRETIVDEETE